MLRVSDVGNTALHLALIENQEAIAMELIQAGADLTAINQENESCLDLARPALKKVIRQKIHDFRQNCISKVV